MVKVLCVLGFNVLIDMVVVLKWGNKFLGVLILLILIVL